MTRGKKEPITLIGSESSTELSEFSFEPSIVHHTTGPQFTPATDRS